MSSPRASSRSVNSMRSSRETYLSNFDRIKTSCNSANVSLEKINCPVSSAFFRAKRLTDEGIIKALIKELVSKIKRLVFT